MEGFIAPDEESDDGLKKGRKKNAAVSPKKGKEQAKGSAKKGSKKK